MRLSFSLSEKTEDSPRYRAEREGFDTKFSKNIFVLQIIFIRYNAMKLQIKNVRRLGNWISKWISKRGI